MLCLIVMVRSGSMSMDILADDDSLSLGLCSRPTARAQRTLYARSSGFMEDARWMIDPCGGGVLFLPVRSYNTIKRTTCNNLQQ